MSHHIQHEDEKIDPHGDFTHVESHLPTSKQNAADDAYAQGQVETGYEGLSIMATIKHFKMAFIVCFAATFAAATDGYQSMYLIRCKHIMLTTVVGINGNIIANPGFVRQFGTELNADGKLILSASVLSAIGTIQSVGQIIGMTTLPL